MEKASQDKRENNTSYQPEIHVRNANSREIFKNNRLTSQFLRNYADIPLLSNVMPEISLVATGTTVIVISCVFSCIRNINLI